MSSVPFSLDCPPRIIPEADDTGQADGAGPHREVGAQTDHGHRAPGLPDRSLKNREAASVTPICRTYLLAEASVGYGPQSASKDPDVVLSNFMRRSRHEPSDGFGGILISRRVSMRPRKPQPRFKSRPYHLRSLTSNFCLIFFGALRATLPGLRKLAGKWHLVRGIWRGEPGP